jgi:hypothetical protein
MRPSKGEGLPPGQSFHYWATDGAAAALLHEQRVLQGDQRGHIVSNLEKNSSYLLHVVATGRDTGLTYRPVATLHNSIGKFLEF